MKQYLDIKSTSQHWLNLLNAGRYRVTEGKVNQGSYRESISRKLFIYKNIFGPQLIIQTFNSSIHRTYRTTYKDWYFGESIPIDYYNMSIEFRAKVADIFSRIENRVDEEAALNKRITKHFEKSS